uniref:Uncharacterized protein n=1 Tax=Glossina austeni TaxID=7395 RepID=A0A1A9VRJ8_GLOAU
MKTDEVDGIINSNKSLHLLLTCELATKISTVNRTSSVPHMKPSSRIFSNIIYCAFHCPSGVPTIVTLRSVCCSSGLSLSSGAIFNEAFEKRIILRICEPFVPIMAPTALFGGLGLVWFSPKF